MCARRDLNSTVKSGLSTIRIVWPLCPPDDFADLLRKFLGACFLAMHFGSFTAPPLLRYVNLKDGLFTSLTRLALKAL